MERASGGLGGGPRRLRVALVATLCVATVSACMPAPEPSTNPVPVPTASPVALDDLPFDVWERLRTAIRQSPDHLPAAAERVVAGRDPQAIFAFVRDEIATLPPSPESWRNAESETRWGTRATLRGGAGTPRDKADLLVELYSAAGFEARVLQGDLEPPAEATGRSILFRSIDRQFEPAVTEAELDEWLGLLGATPSPVSPPPELAGLRAEIAEAVAIAADLPGQPDAFDWASLRAVPVVEVTVNGAPVLANPIMPDAQFGTSYTGPTVIAGPSSRSQPVSVSLLISTAREPDERVAIATGAWPADELIGRFVDVRMAPAGDPATVLRLGADQVQTFVPTLALAGPDLDPATADERTFVGDAFTVRGTVIRATDETVTVGTRPLMGAPPDLDALMARIAGISIEVDAQAFPSLRGRAAIVDASGQPVLGVPGSALRLEEDGRSLGFVLEENQPPAPRVVLLFDTSGSIPDAFREAGAEALGRDLTTAITAERPDALVRAAPIASGGAPSLRDYSADPDVVAEEIRTMYGYGSDIWSATASAAQHDPTVIVLISDGQSSETPELIDTARALVAAGPPVVAIGVGEADMVSLATLAGSTGGSAFAATDTPAAVAGILAALASQDGLPYRFSFEAPEDGPSTRTVTLAPARTPGVAGEAAYAPPIADRRLQPPALAGVYLRVEHEGVEFVHTIAGPNHYDRKPGQRITPALLDEVRGALFGAVLVSVEGSPPSISTLLDEQLTAKLSLRPAFEGARAGDGEAILAGLREALTIPAVLGQLHAPLWENVTADSLTYELRPRFVVYQERIRWERDVVTSASILPLSRWVTVADDPEAARQLTIERTASLAAIEGASFETSTLSTLRGQTVELLPAFDLSDSDPPPARVAQRAYSGWQRVVATDDAIGAFWALDPDTGTLLGVLPDGSGGGATSDTEKSIKQLGQIAALMALLAGLAGGGFPAYAFVALQRAILAQILREAAIVASIGEDSMPTDSMDQTLRELTCDLAKAAFASIAHHTSHTAYNVAVADKASKAAGGPYIPCGF